MTMVDFYDDIDLDFGDKLVGVGEAIRFYDGDSKKKTAEKKQHKKTNVIVFEDEVDDDEYELYDSGPIDDASFVETVDNIAREVSEVTGNALLNERLELQYKTNNATTSSKLKSKPKTKKSSNKPLPPPTKNRNILSKAELRKEMGAGSDGKVAFAPRSNALLKALECSPKKEQISQTETKVSDTKMQDPVDKVRAWLEQSSDEDIYYSLNNSSSSASYHSLTPASASEAEVRRYRATSKRLSGVGVVTTSTPISDEKVHFAPVPKPAPSPSQPSKKKSPKKNSPKRSTNCKMEKHEEVYVPGSYHLDFHFDQNEFPAIK